MLNLDFSRQGATQTVPPPTGSAQPRSLAPNPASGGPAAEGGRSGRPITPVATQSSDSLIAIASGATLALVLLTGATASFLTARSKGEVAKQQASVDASQRALRSGPTATAFAHIKTVDQELKTLTGFTSDALAWPSILDGLARLLPKSIKLSNTTFGADKTVRLEGEAASQQDVATLMAALEQSQQFTRPVLGSVALNESTDGSVVVFSLSTELKASKNLELRTQNLGDTNAASDSTKTSSTPTTTPTTTTGPEASGTSATTPTQRSGPDAGGGSQ